MKHEEVAQTFVLELTRAIEFFRERRIECLVGKQAPKFFDSRFYELDARGFEGLEERPQRYESMAADPGRLKEFITAKA